MSEAKSYHDAQWAIYKERILKLLKNHRTDLRNTTGALPLTQVPILPQDKIEDGAITPAKLSFDPATQAELDAEAAARLAADTAEAATRAAADSTHAALTTSAHGGIVASSDARLSDARTPTAHAPTHQHGGTDQIATDTPGANAIPKALALGTLADGWLSSALSRITSIALAAPGQFSVAGSPLLGNGTLTLSWTTQVANLVLAGPSSGGAALPTFRALAAADLPAHSASLITSGQLALARGGTNADLSATGGANQIVRQNSAGGAFTVGALAAADLPSTGVGVGGYGGPSTPVSFTVDAQGRLTAALNETYALPASAITTGRLAVARGGTGVAAIPAFSAWMTVGQTIAPSTYTKLVVNNEFRDTNANYDTTTQRFTPTAAGTYLFTAYAVYVAPTQDQKGFGLYVYKNGARSLVVENYMVTSGAGDFSVSLTGFLAANGSTDYFELYTVQYTTINVSVWEGGGNFSAVWVGP